MSIIGGMLAGAAAGGAQAASGLASIEIKMKKEREALRARALSDMQQWRTKRQEKATDDVAVAERERAARALTEQRKYDEEQARVKRSAELEKARAGKSNIEFVTEDVFDPETGAKIGQQTRRFDRTTGKELFSGGGRTGAPDPSVAPDSPVAPVPPDPAAMKEIMAEGARRIAAGTVDLRAFVTRLREARVPEAEIRAFVDANSPSKQKTTPVTSQAPSPGLVGSGIDARAQQIAENEAAQRDAAIKAVGAARDAKVSRLRKSAGTEANARTYREVEAFLYDAINNQYRGRKTDLEDIRAAYTRLEAVMQFMTEAERKKAAVVLDGLAKLAR